MSFCAARVSVGPLRQEYWAIWDRAAQEFRERSHLFKRRVQIEPNRLRVDDGDVAIFCGLSGVPPDDLPAPSAVDPKTAERLRQGAARALERYGDYGPQDVP